MATVNNTSQTIEIQLTKGCVTVIDEQDAILAQVKWCAQYNDCIHGYYAVRSVGGRKNTKRIKLHNAVMERILGGPIPDGYIVDHINRISLDNSRGNLRLATFAQNMRNQGVSKANTSGFKGVSFNKSKKRWTSNIRVNRKSIQLGDYDNPIDAAIAYNHAAIKYFGEFAFLNPIEGWENKYPKRKKRGSLSLSGYTGVSYYPNKKKWRARLHINGHYISLGYFETPELAYVAWCHAANERNH